MSQTIQIEDNPKLRGFLRSTAEWSFTALMWALWFYLFLPMISFILWIVGAGYIFVSLFEKETYIHLLTLYQRVGCAVLIIFIILRGWGFYNYYTFGRKNRRKQYTILKDTDLGCHFGITVPEVKIMRTDKEILWTTLYKGSSSI